VKLPLTLLPLALLIAAVACQKSPEQQDHPRLTPNVRMQDVTFHSVALDRDVLYRVILPAVIPVAKKLPVLYLLHGNGESYKSWSNDSDVAQFAERGLILVMPEGGSSYYVNAAERSHDRYEDYIVRDLIPEVEKQFPAAPARGQRAVAGVSMGGFGAIVLALKHPELFAFVGALSPALDVPSRPFSMKRVSQYRQHRSIFGPWGSPTRSANDPYVLVRMANPATMSYVFLECGQQEGLLPANKRFAATLQRRQFKYEFHAVSGGHDWNQWNRSLPDLFESLRNRLSSN
jgi:S-formylglutathione hydrolase FrmB